MSVLDLKLNGNPQLDSDPNCKKKKREISYSMRCLLDRQHVLDCLPRVWMFDGIFVSSKF